MGLEDDPIRRVLTAHPRPELPEDFAATLMQRVGQEEWQRRRQEQQRGHGLATRLLLGTYWLAALVASVSILRQGPLPDWTGAALWCAALALVPAGYAFALWYGIAHANHDRT